MLHMRRGDMPGHARRGEMTCEKAVCRGREWGRTGKAREGRDGGVLWNARRGVRM
jgi:hypothetical protein